jgi:peptidoglycan/LPS O-acetylase OafA/YrhL
MAENDVRQHDLEEHMRSYRAFLKGVVVVIIASAFTLVALSVFAFGQTMPILLGWAGLIFGALAMIIDLRSETNSWRLSIITLIVFGLLTAINVS